MDSDTRHRVQRELEAHEADSVLENSYRLKDRFSHIWNYPSRREMRGYVDAAVARMAGRAVLDYGCGWGEESARYLAAGASVFGIDISPRLVEAARKRAVSCCPDSGRFRFEVMDAHQLAIVEDSFDFVIGNGILHHLDQETALREVFRVLRPGGEAIFLEPLADNPLLRLFRWLTPAARTADERPLSGDDLRAHERMLPWKADYRFCGIVEAPVAMLTSVIMPRRPDNMLLRLAHWIERGVLRQRILSSWNQYVLLVFRKAG